MNNDTISLLQECSAGANMAMSAIDQVLEGVENPALRDALTESRRVHDRIDQFLIIVGNSKSLCNGLADGAAAAAKLTADGDNFVGHMDSPFSWWLHYTPISRN